MVAACRIEFGLLLLAARLQILRFRFARGQALFDRADLLGLQLQPAARALGFEIQFGHARARRGQLGFGPIAGFLDAGVLAFLLLQLPGDLGEQSLRLAQVERHAGGVALQHPESPGHGLAQERHHLRAQFLVAPRLGRLPLERIHLPRDFFQDVEHARQVLLGAFELGFGQPLARLVLADAGGFFDDRAAVGRLVGKNLADAALLDDGVAFRPEAGAHEQVLDVAQAGGLAVDQVFAFAGPVQAARDGDLFADVGGRSRRSRCRSQ